MAKLDGYGFNRDTAAWRNRKECIRITGTQIYLGDIISGVPQGSILRLILNSFVFIYFA